MSSRTRKKATRNIKPVFYIYTEGEETEINYIRSYINDYLKSKCYIDHDIIVKQPEDNSPYGLLKEAKKTKKTQDNCYLVFDHDQHPYMSKTFAEAKNSEIKIAYSSISFETWILMHFEYSAKSFSNSSQVEKHLNQYFKNSYKKSLNNLFALACGKKCERLSVAIKNAKMLCKEAEANNPNKQIYDMNPYTNIHELLAAIDGYIANKK